MKLSSTPSPLGDFSVFGMNLGQNELLMQRFQSQLGVYPRITSLGERGHLFFYSSYGEVAESPAALVLKLGFARSPGNAALAAWQILEQGIATPETIRAEALQGNALVACLGKQTPVFSVFKTVLSVPQLYYAPLENGILCSDRLVCLVKLLERVDLNEDAVPMHFLFRQSPGERTYYQQIKRLRPGMLLKWDAGQMSERLVQDLTFGQQDYRFLREDKAALDALNSSLGHVVKNAVIQAEACNPGSLAVLLSGGVDSSLIQHYVNQCIFPDSARSFSYAVQAPSFAHEIEYARQASKWFQTEHTFVRFQPEDYPGLLMRTIDLLGQPPILETEPSMLSIAELSPVGSSGVRYYLSGQGADTLFGLGMSRKLKGLNLVSKLPGARHGLGILSKAMTPFPSARQALRKGAAILAGAGNPDDLFAPPNTIVIYSEFEQLRRCFSDAVLRETLRYRREFAAAYLHQRHYLEWVHGIDLMTDTYELGVQRQQVFLAHRKEQIHPFFDDETLRVSFAFHPDVRYLQGLRPKYLLKDLLERETGSPVARKPKGLSIFESDLYAWMQRGPLRPFVQEIQRPGFLSQADFERMRQAPNYFLWVLLTFDLFQRQCLSR